MASAVNIPDLQAKVEHTTSISEHLHKRLEDKKKKYPINSSDPIYIYIFDVHSFLVHFTPIKLLQSYFDL